MEILKDLWELVGQGSGLVTKALIVYVVIFFKTEIKKFHQDYQGHDNRIGEIEDKQESLVIGLKAVPTMNGTFTTAYDDSLRELRTVRDRKSKNIIQ